MSLSLPLYLEGAQDNLTGAGLLTESLCFGPQGSSYGREASRAVSEAGVSSQHTQLHLTVPSSKRTMRLSSWMASKQRLLRQLEWSAGLCSDSQQGSPPYAEDQLSRASSRRKLASLFRGETCKPSPLLRNAVCTPDGAEGRLGLVLPSCLHIVSLCCVPGPLRGQSKDPAPTCPRRAGRKGRS